MPIVRTIIEKLMLRLAGRNEYQSATLRRYFARQYGIRIGLYTIGAFDRWRIPPNSVVGRYCSIAKTARLLDGNHPVESLSTHPYFYLRQFGVVDSDRVVVQAPVVEDDVWLGHQCIVMPSCHRIGRGAVVGAGAIVMNDVLPYAIVSGAPAKLVRFRFPAEVIDAIEATQWWLLDKPELEAALRKAPDFAFAPTRSNADAFLHALGRPPLPPYMPAGGSSGPAIEGGKVTLSREAVLDLIRRELPNFAEADLDRPLAELEIDSFGLINLRIGLETLIERQIPDRAWGAIVTPADFLHITGSTIPPQPPAARTPTVTESMEAIDVSRPSAERRVQHVNMPQMALSGLSEPWLFKELGDIHWSVLTRGLRTPSAAVADSEGDRLYATFTRLQLTADKPLTDIAENDRLTLDLEMERFGAGMFFSTARLKAAAGSAQAHIMTSFSKFGEAGANTSLLKGQPVIPDDCEIPALSDLPPFAREYREQRARELPAPIFETEYEILPPHDINGVGLLYFAAYPTIIDLCAMQRLGRELFADFSTTHRDVFYFANSGPNETLVFRLHRLDESRGEISYDASLSRRSDGKIMAFATTVKCRLGKRRPGAPAKVTTASV